MLVCLHKKLMGLRNGNGLALAHNRSLNYSQLGLHRIRWLGLSGLSAEFWGPSSTFET